MRAYNRVLVLLTLTLGTAQAKVPLEPVVYVQPLTMQQSRLGWLVSHADASTDRLALHQNDLIEEVDSTKASRVGPLMLINLFDEAYSRSIPVLVKREGKSVHIMLRGSRQYRDSSQGVKRKTSLGAATGVRTPAFATHDIKGHDISFRRFDGKWILLTFGASWCGPCVAEVPSIKHLSETSGQKLAIVMFALHEKPNALQSFVATQHIPYSVVETDDPYSAIPIGYGVSSPDGASAIPVNILIRPDRSIAYVQVGASDPQMIYRSVVQIIKK